MRRRYIPGPPDRLPPSLGWVIIAALLYLALQACGSSLSGAWLWLTTSAPEAPKPNPPAVVKDQAPQPKATAGDEAAPAPTSAAPGASKSTEPQQEPAQPVTPGPSSPAPQPAEASLALKQDAPPSAIAQVVNQARADFTMRDSDAPVRVTREQIAELLIAVRDIQGAIPEVIGFYAATDACTSRALSEEPRRRHITRTLGYGTDETLRVLWKVILDGQAARSSLQRETISGHAEEATQVIAAFIEALAADPDGAPVRFLREGYKAPPTERSRALQRPLVRFWDARWAAIGNPPVNIAWPEGVGTVEPATYLPELQSIEKTLELALLPPMEVPRGLIEQLHTMQRTLLVLSLQAVQVDAALAALSRAVPGFGWIPRDTPVPPLPIRFAIRKQVADADAAGQAPVLLGLELVPRFQVQYAPPAKAPEPPPAAPPQTIPVGMTTSQARYLCEALLRDLRTQRTASIAVRAQELRGKLPLNGLTRGMLDDTVTDWDKAIRAAEAVLGESWAQATVWAEPKQPAAQAASWADHLASAFSGLLRKPSRSTPRASGMEGLLLANLELRSPEPPPTPTDEPRHQLTGDLETLLAAPVPGPPADPEPPKRHPSHFFLDHIKALLRMNSRFAEASAKAGYADWPTLDVTLNAVVARLEKAYVYAPPPVANHAVVVPIPELPETPTDFLRRTVGYLTAFQ